MRKEVLFAVIFGIILGSVILFGINLANKSISSLPAQKESLQATEIPTPALPKKYFEIINPQNHAVISGKTSQISGKATPNSTIAIITESDDLIIDATPEGSFSAQINLISGENTLTVTNLLSDKTMQTQTITVIQSNTPTE